MARGGTLRGGRGAVRREAWAEATAAKSVSGYLRYIELHPAGGHAAETTEKIEALHWQAAVESNSVYGFVQYLEQQPAGPHVPEARGRIAALRWQEATTAHSVDSYETYLQLHPEGENAAEAREQIEALRWEEATAAETVGALERYPEIHPEGLHAAEAESKVEALRADPAPYEAAVEAGTEAALRAFLDDFPGHARQAEAEQALGEMREGRPITDLVEEGKVEVESQGSGIQTVAVRLRKRVPYPLTVLIPAGTHFVSSDPSAQNILTTLASRVRLEAGDWQSLDVAAACANRSREIPSDRDRFAVQRLPHEA